MGGEKARAELDWEAITKAMAPVPIIDDPVTVKKRSRDYFWYSPILNERLRRSFAERVARPETMDQLRHCLATAWRFDLPMVARGGGTGNYGQAVPLDGGLVIDLTALDRVMEIGDGFVRAEAGALMADINAGLAPHGAELCMFPSTQNIATIGGFVAGGSSGIGSIANGMLREAGNLIELKALSVEEEPQEHIFTGEAVLDIHHAWGLNGVITEVTIRTVPRRDWVHCIASFQGYGKAYRAGHALAERAELGAKLVSVVDRRIAAYFPALKGIVANGADLLVSLVPKEALDDVKALVEGRGGQLSIAMGEEERNSKGLPHAFEFSYNHTTLQVLKADRGVTYQQIGTPDPADYASIDRLNAALGDRAWQHHEFARLGGEVISFDIPIIPFESEGQLRGVDALYESHGFSVYDAHTFHVEGGGLKNADFRHLAWKKRMDPKGLLNSGKSRAWPLVRHLPADEIAALTELPGDGNE